MSGLVRNPDDRFSRDGAELILWRSRAAVMMGVKIELEWKNKTEKMKGKIVIKLLLRDYSFIKDNHYSQPRSKKTGLRGFRSGPTLIGLYNHRIWLEA